MRRYLLAFLAVFLSFVGMTQDHCTPVIESALGRNPFLNKTRPAEVRLFFLDEAAMKTELQNAPSESVVAAKTSPLIITIPDEAGQPEQFRVVEAPIMMPGLA